MSIEYSQESKQSGPMSTEEQTGGTIVLGIGNRLGGDDAAGICVVDMLKPALRPLAAGRHKARTLHSRGVTAIDAGTAPESYTSVIRRHRPDLLILVDAADMGLPPGTRRTIPLEKISLLSFSTHHMPLSMFVSYVDEFCGKVLLVGVQPEGTEMGDHLSEAVRKSVNELVEVILEGRVAETPLLR
jgi:hydrogenase 3 maturation protease